MAEQSPRMITAQQELYHEPETDYLEAAKILARYLDSHRLRAKDGSPTWRRPDRPKPGVPPPTTPPMVAAGPHLYDGLPGIAIFYAALGRVEDDERHRDLALEIVAPLRRLLSRLAAEPERARKMHLEIGGLTGVGSFVYMLVTLGRLLDAPELFEEAHEVASLITEDHISRDEKLDVVSGAPGAILALLELERHAPGPSPRGKTPLDLAGDCARHLSSRRIARPDGSVAWTTFPDYPPLTGFAHGSTGICCALLKLYARTGEPDLSSTVERGWTFERSTYSERHRNWIDQTSTTGGFSNQWCFGAPGIALGRLATLHIVDEPRVRAEIDSGLKATADPNLSSSDHLCCGDMGRVDVLTYGYEKLGEPWLFEAAGVIARGVVDRIERTGRVRGYVKCDDFDPSFFSGGAGIGYALLRLARPGELPCLLALE